MSGLLLYEFFENCGLDHILSGFVSNDIFVYNNNLLLTQEMF